MIFAQWDFITKENSKSDDIEITAIGRVENLKHIRKFMQLLTLRREQIWILLLAFILKFDRICI